MKPLVIYHANCTDGFGAAFAAWTVLGDDAEYVPCHYGDGNFTNPQDIRDRVDGRTVYILDFSLPRPAMDQMFADAGKVVWLDHHKTAFEAYGWSEKTPLSAADVGAAGSHFVDLDNSRSGALLAWEYFHPDTSAPDLIRMIDDRDRWQFKLTHSKALHAGLRLYGFDFARWAKLVPPATRAASYSLDRVIADGYTMLQVYDEQIKSAVRRAEQVFIPVGNPDYGVYGPGLAVNSPIHQSEIGHELAIASGTYGLVWYYDAATRRANCSLRSNGDYDVSAIAKAFGGGGHKNAAGFNTDMRSLLDWLGG